MDDAARIAAGFRAEFKAVSAALEAILYGRPDLGEQFGEQIIATFPQRYWHLMKIAVDLQIEESEL